MDSEKFKTLDLPVHYVLQQVTNSIRYQNPELRMTIDPWAPDLTLTTLLAAVSQALQPVDREILLFPQGTKQEKEALKKVLLFRPELTPKLSTITSDELPIQTSVPKYLEPRRPAPEMQENLRKLAKEMMKLPNRQPYILQTTANITEGVLPTVSGKIRLRGLDEDPDEPFGEIEISQESMLWDTGSHGCTITRDVLPEGFLEYLARSEHDPYRDESGTKVQVDGHLSFSNQAFYFNTVFTVVPQSSIPNSRSGIILGQHGFINRMEHTEIPREILRSGGQACGVDKWGNINISKWIDLNGDLQNL